MLRLSTGDVFLYFYVPEAFKGNASIDQLMDCKSMMFVILRYSGCTVCRYDVYMLVPKINKSKEKGVNEENRQQFLAFFYVNANGIVLTTNYAKTIVDMSSIDEMLGMIILKNI